MITIIKHEKYISGVFSDKAKALNYLETNENYKEFNSFNYNIDVTNIENYPFYIFEIFKNNEFIYENCKTKVYQKIIDFKGEEEGHEYDYASLYIIRKDYYPKTVLGDYMGSLEHVHIDNHLVKVAKSMGESFLDHVFRVD